MLCADSKLHDLWGITGYIWLLGIILGVLTWLSREGQRLPPLLPELSVVGGVTELISILRSDLESQGWSGPLTSVWTSASIFTGATLALLLSSQLSHLWRAVNLSFQEKSSVRPFIHPSFHPSRTSSSADDTRRSLQRLANLPRIHWGLWFHLAGGKTQVRSCCRTSKPRPREEKIYMLVVFPRQVDPCLYTMFSLLWQLLWPEL